MTPWLNRALHWIGWLFSLGAVSILLMSARWKTDHRPLVCEGVGRIGWDPSMLPRIGAIQLASVVLYLIPQTSVLGVVLLTGYLGGAISRYTRMQEPYPVPVPLTTALFAWAGLYLREPRLWTLLPLRRRSD